MVDEASHDDAATPDVATANDQHGIHADDLDATGQIDEQNPQVPNTVELPSGDALSSEEASAITAATRTQVVLISGSAESGKTTLIAALFHCFQRGRFAGYMFAGSQTLVGFEKRCHKARISSGGLRPESDRTRPDETRSFLHLRLRKNASPICNVLFADLSAEYYERARNSVEACCELGLIRRADHFVVLIDGEKIIQPTERQRAKNEALMLLRSCLDAGLLDSTSFVDVLFSKWDLVMSSTDVREHFEFIRESQAQLRKDVAPRIARLRFFKIAARGTTPEHPLGHGLNKVLPSWIQDTPRSAPATDDPLANIEDLTEFDRFKWRHSGFHAEA